MLLSLLVLLAGAAGLYLHTRLARLQAALDSQAVLLAAPRPHLGYTAKPVQHSNGQPAGTNGKTARILVVLFLPTCYQQDSQADLAEVYISPPLPLAGH